MFEQTPDSIVLLDAESGKIIDFNASAHEGLGYTRAEFSKLAVSDYQEEHGPAEIAKNIERVISGSQLGCETKHKRKDGTIVEVALTIRPLTIRRNAYNFGRIA